MSRMPETIVVGPDPDPATVRAAAVCVVGNCGPDRDVLGAIGVSGLSEEEDHRLATELTHALGQHLISNGDLNRGIS